MPGAVQLGSIYFIYSSLVSSLMLFFLLNNLLSVITCFWYMFSIINVWTRTLIFEEMETKIAYRDRILTWNAFNYCADDVMSNNMAAARISRCLDKSRVLVSSLWFGLSDWFDAWEAIPFYAKIFKVLCNIVSHWLESYPVNHENCSYCLQDNLLPCTLDGTILG